MSITNFSTLSPEEQLEQARKSGKWFACSLFITYYRGFGYKFEADPVRYLSDGSIQTDGLNIDGSTYQDTKKRFWAEWNRRHPSQHLTILKSMSSSG